MKEKTLDKRERLQLFAEYACYRATGIQLIVDADVEPDTDINIIQTDPGHPDNLEKAGKWFEKKLNFLSKRDAEELKQIWERAVDDGGYVRVLFNAIKVLQEKYED